MIPSSEREAPRRGPSAAKRSVRSWRTLISRRGGLSIALPPRISRTSGGLSAVDLAASLGLDLVYELSQFLCQRAMQEPDSACTFLPHLLRDRKSVV